MSTLNTLGNKTAVKLLEVLLDNPLHEFKEIELIKNAKTGKGSASSAITSLVKEKILTEKRIGKSKVIALNVLSPAVYALKNIFDKDRMVAMEIARIACVLLFKDLVKDKVSLLVVFGSSIDNTATKDSDIDILFVSNNSAKTKMNNHDGEGNITEIDKQRKKVEELFGIRFNLHSYTINDVIGKLQADKLLKAALLKGILIYGQETYKKLFLIIAEKKEKYSSIERLIFINERVKSALRNFLNNDHKTSAEILDKALEQLIYYLLTEKQASYASKTDAIQLIKQFPEGTIIEKIYKAKLREKISLSEKFIIELINITILKNNGIG